MLDRFQKYSIFFSKEGLITLPLLVMVLSRTTFVFFYENAYARFSISDYLLQPLIYDLLLFLLGFGLMQYLRSQIILFLYALYLTFSNLIFFHHFKIYFLPPGVGAIAALFETTPLEAIEFTKLTSIKELLSTISISILPLLALFFVPLKTKIHPRKLFLSCIPLIGLSIITHLPYINSPKDSFKPMDLSHQLNDIKNIIHYGREYYQLISLRENRLAAKFEAEQRKDLRDKLQIHILILGESLARNHMSLYGYHLKTTPRLEERINLIAYRNVISPTTQTRSALVRILTPAFGLETDRFYEEGSIITAMEEAGFNTYWISNQGRYGISDTETSALADDADQAFFVNTDWNAKSLDEKVIKKLREVIEYGEKKQFIVLHLLGSHFEYLNRVPNNFDLFKSYEYELPHLNEEQLKKVIHYDATVKYTDMVIDSVISILKKSVNPSSLTYISDHGEDIYDDERKLIGHGSPILSRYTVEVPLLLWRDSLFQSSQTIPPQREQLDVFYNSGNLFHALTDLYDLDFSSYEPKRSIFSLEYQNDYPYVINSNNQLINYHHLEK